MGMLRLIQSGLIGFVPAKRLGRELMIVLLPRVAKGQTLVGPEPKALTSHHSFLRFDRKYMPSLADSPRKPDWLIQNQSSGKSEYIVFLDDEDLKINTGNTTLEDFKIVTGLAGQLDPQPNAALPLRDYLKAKSDFKWVPSFEKVTPGRGRVDRDCIGPNESNLINVRLTVEEGYYTTYKVAGTEAAGEKDPDKVDICKFEVPGPGDDFRQTIADQVLLSVNFRSSILGFSSARISDSAKVLPDLRLTPDEDGMIEVQLQNLELDGLLRPESGQIATSDIEDFGIFYELLSSRPPAGNRRLPVVLGGGAGQRICPTGAFSIEVLQ